MEVQLADAEITFIEGGVLQNLRNDGRAKDEYRPILLEAGLVPNAYGSARIRLGNTDVLVGVKAEVDKPIQSAPDRGRIQFFVDCSANATPQFEGRGGQDLAEDVSRALTTAYANDACLDLRRLSLVKGRMCWLLYIDVVILEFGGNPYDAASLAVKAALFNTKFPNVNIVSGDSDEMDIDLTDDPSDCWSLDVTNAPIFITVGKVGFGDVVDLTREEEVCCKASLLVAVVGMEQQQQFVTLIRKIHRGSLDPDSVEEMVALAVKVGGKLQQNLMEKLKVEAEDGRKRVGFMAIT